MSVRWSTRIVFLHWASAGVVATLAAVGFVMTDLPADSSLRLHLSRLHSALGLALVVLMAVRLLSRWRGERPEPLPLAPLHQRAIRLLDGLLYASLLGLIASGLMTAFRTAWPQYIRGALATAPDIGHVASRGVHETLVLVLLSLVALHIGGVVIHEVRRGGTLRRMIPKGRF